MPTTSDLKYGFKFDSTAISYSFSYANSLWNGQYDPGDGNLGTTFSAASKAALVGQTRFSAAVDLWGNYTKFDFSSVSGGGADIYAYETDVADRGTTGYFETESDEVAAEPDGPFYTRAEIVFNSNGVTDDAFGRYSALHEIGHSLGLKGDLLIPSDFTSDMTVMSYNIAGGSRYAATPMAYDIAAIADLYGAPTYDPRDTYAAETFTGNKRSLTILDTGTTQDTFNLSGVTGSHYIDLREAANDNQISYPVKNEDDRIQKFYLHGRVV